MDNLETNTMILEQCRLDMENLAALGSAGMNEAVAKAEKRARICGQELRQATKAVELTAKQKKTVEDARLAGEEKLSAATKDEDDARVAAETVKRMIEDASSVRGNSNRDTAKILEKAENVLDDTYNRAAQFYQEKKRQREEIETAMLRLYATEKAVLYTMAKAERNEGEKQLSKVIAEKKHEVCANEYEVLLLRANHEDLRDRETNHQTALRCLEDDIRQADGQVEQCAYALEQTEADFTNQIELCRRQNEDELSVLEKEKDACETQKIQADAELEETERQLSQRKQDKEMWTTRLTQVEIQTKEDIAAARRAYESGVIEEDKQVSRHQEELRLSHVALQDAEAKRDSSVAEAERLRGLANDFASRAADAEAEEVSAREAAETANRLAENAIKIRESISSESSQLLLHAQEVLMEAAASAQQLMDEKSLMRVAAQNESDRISKQAAVAEATSQQAKQQVDSKRMACREAEMQLDQARQSAVAQKTHLVDVRDQAIAAAEDQLENAKQQLKEAEDDLLRAIEARDAAGKRVEDTENALTESTRRIGQAEKDGKARIADLEKRSEQELAKLKAQHEQATARVEHLQKNRAQEEASIAVLQQDIAGLVQQIEEASAKVQNLISNGADAIREAEEDLQRRTLEERNAHQVAEDAVAQMSARNQQQGMEEPELRSINNLTELIVDETPTASETGSLAAQIAEQFSDDLTLALVPDPEETIAELMGDPAPQSVPVAGYTPEPTEAAPAAVEEDGISAELLRKLVGLEEETSAPAPAAPEPVVSELASSQEMADIDSLVEMAAHISEGQGEPEVPAEALIPEEAPVEEAPAEPEAAAAPEEATITEAPTTIEAAAEAEPAAEEALIEEVPAEALPTEEPLIPEEEAEAPAEEEAAPEEEKTEVKPVNLPFFPEPVALDDGETPLIPDDLAFEPVPEDGDGLGDWGLSEAGILEAPLFQPEPLPEEAGIIEEAPAEEPLIPEEEAETPLFQPEQPAEEAGIIEEAPAEEPLIPEEAAEAPLPVPEEAPAEPTEDEEEETSFAARVAQMNNREQDGEVDEVAQAVMRAVTEAAARVGNAEDGDQPYDMRELTVELPKELETTGDWRLTDMTEEEREYTSRLEDVSAKLLEHTIIPVEEEKAPAERQEMDPGDWLANLTRSLGEEPVLTDPEEKPEDNGLNEIDLEALLKGSMPQPVEREKEKPGLDNQIRVPEMELPTEKEQPNRTSVNAGSQRGGKKRRFPFFNN